MRFSRYRLHFFIFSLLLTVVLYSYTFFVHHGFAESITFSGGVRISLLMPPGSTRDELENSLKQIGFRDAQVRLTDPRINKFDVEMGPEVRERLESELRSHKQENTPNQPAIQKKENEKDNIIPAVEKNVSTILEQKLIEGIPYITKESIISREIISASYGEELMKMATWSLVLVIILIGIYLSFRFDFPFAFGASLSLVHDVIICLGFIGAMKIEPSIPVLAAILTLLGYSINDTIVIFDRIRSNFQEGTKVHSPEVMDKAITQTLSRTVTTSILTLISVLALLLGGADSLKDFAVILVFGIAIGTYSSIFIAVHSVQYYEEFRLKLLRR